MRLLTWNINGIRTLPSYHPWNTLKTGENILNELGADIICFQEIKSSRRALEKHVAVPAGYDAFYSFPLSKTGYSGVGVFTKCTSVIALKAEEGLSGCLTSGLKPPLTQEERVSPAYPKLEDIEIYIDESGSVPQDLLSLDTEGRALVIDFGLFVLINLYCPNETSEARLPYKMNFHRLLSERVRRLIELEGREVIVTGDINVCATPIDHCDGELASSQEDFWSHPARAWFRDWLAPRGPMIDVVRSCWPERKGMFTCWNQKIDARVSNYGTRIDHFLLTKGLLPWFKHGDIQTAVKGSDHCPVYIDLHDSIVDENGKTLFLRDMLHMNGKGATRKAPRLATKYWNEYSGKQKLLSSFFGKKSTQSSESIVLSPSASISETPASSAPTPANDPPPTPSDYASSSQVTSVVPPSTPSSSQKIQASDLLPTLSLSPSTIASATEVLEVAPPLHVKPIKNKRTSTPSTENTSWPPARGAKRKKIQADSNYPPQAPKSKRVKYASITNGGKVQKSLGSFLASTPGASSSKSESEKIISTPLEEGNGAEDDVILIEDREPTPSPASGNTNSAQAWSTLFARIEPPRCFVHGEPAREFTVNKPGPNKGKMFFLCSRPVGPGYDAGRDKRLREEVDPQYRCNFFKWSSEVKRAALQEAQKDTEKQPTCSQ